MNRRGFLIGSLFLMGAVVYMLVVGWWRTAKQARNVNDVLPLPVSKMAFTLTDHSGQTFTPASWLGRPTMVFFGFTFCPDICPTTLNEISEWLDALGSDADLLNVALISVDPERDTPEALASYLLNFDQRVTGLTGSLAEVEKAVADFRAVFEKIPVEGDYTINHTSGVFLFRADGIFASTIDFHEDRRFAIPKLRRILI